MIKLHYSNMSFTSYLRWYYSAASPTDGRSGVLFCVKNHTG